MNRELKRYLSTPVIFTGLYKKVLISGAVFLGIMCILPWTIFASGSGQVTALNPNERIQEITAPVTGFIGTWHVSEGDQVKKGQKIVDLVDNDANLIERMTQERDASKQAVDSSALAVKTARINLERQEKLFEEGLASRKEFEKAKIEVSKLSVELSKSISALAKAETQISRQHTQKVEAPRDGRILRVMSGEGNRLAKSGEVLVVFAPEFTTPAIQVWVQGADIPFLKVGQLARVEFEGWPSIQVPGWPSVAIGTFRGKVHLVDYASSYLGKFRVLIVPDEPWPSDKILKLNANARANIFFRDTMVGVELWRKFNNFPPLQGPIQDELDNMLKGKKPSSAASEEK
jgi:multidrug efflux pump subunit AcrA (membrane-fusion protein)